MVLDTIADFLDIDLKEKRDCLTGKGSMEGDGVFLIEPLTFMNNSGLAVRDVLKRHNILPENLIVIHDDLDMETGKLKIRKDGSSRRAQGNRVSNPEYRHKGIYKSENRHWQGNRDAG